jgi:hypothetical protein
MSSARRDCQRRDASAGMRSEVVYDGMLTQASVDPGKPEAEEKCGRSMYCAQYTGLIRRIASFIYGSVDAYRS